MHSNLDDTHAEETLFTTLVESRAIRRRSTRGAAISIGLHLMLVVTAVGIMHPKLVQATPDQNPEHPPVYVPAPPPIRDPQPADAPARPAEPSAPDVGSLHIVPPTITPPSLPPIDNAGPVLPPDHITIGGGVTPPGILGAGEGARTFAPGSVLDAEVVDRVPRIIGNAPAPRYPDVLRQSGATGQVVVRFVVDTLGRAEMGELIVVEATHPLFASAVKSALLGYRFTPGEAGGRKVRTLVQVPFTFTLH